jgi:glycosyltransferase involved in cell wall biosynthesis
MLNVLNHANALLIGCESFATEVIDRLGVARERFTIVPGAVDTDRFRPAEGLCRARPRIRCGCSTTARRPAERLARHDRGAGPAAGGGRALRRDHLGIGPDYDSSRALAAERACPSASPAMRITTRRRRSTARRCLRQPDLCRRGSATRSRGDGERPAERRCYAVGVVDCLRDGENGLLVQPGDIPALAQALRRVIEDAPLRRRLASEALEECRRTYSWEAVGRQIMDVYAEVAGRAPDTGFDRPAA